MLQASRRCSSRWGSGGTDLRGTDLETHQLNQFGKLILHGTNSTFTGSGVKEKDVSGGKSISIGWIYISLSWPAVLTISSSMKFSFSSLSSHAVKKSRPK
jgi:hypothetical protein